MIYLVNGVTIQDFWLRCKVLLEAGLLEYGLFLLLCTVALGSFGLGRLSVLESVQPLIAIRSTPAAANIMALAPGGYVVASRSGSVYYLPWCAGAQKITADKQVWFSSEATAQQAGYSPSKSCKGLVQ